MEIIHSIASSSILIDCGLIFIIFSFDYYFCFMDSGKNRRKKIKLCIKLLERTQVLKKRVQCDEETF